MPSPALRTTRVGVAVAGEVGRLDLGGQQARRERTNLGESPSSVGVERDRVVIGIDAGDEGTLASRHDGKIAGWEVGVNRDGRFEGAGFAGLTLPPEDLAGLIDDQQIVDTVTGEVGQDGCCMHGCRECTGIGKGVIALI